MFTLHPAVYEHLKKSFDKFIISTQALPTFSATALAPGTTPPTSPEARALRENLRLGFAGS